MRCNEPCFGYTIVERVDSGAVRILAPDGDYVCDQDNPINFDSWEDAKAWIKDNPLPMYSYLVELAGTAYISQKCRITARSEEEAREIALETTGDREWKYEGEIGASIDVETCELDPRY